MRSVSFTRQLPMLRSVLVPSANSAATAAVIAASGNVIEIGVDRLELAAARRLPAPAPASIQFSPIAIVAPMRSSASAKRTSPWMLARPTPSTRTGPPPVSPLITPAARKYDADEASPSTWISPGLV